MMLTKSNIMKFISGFVLSITLLNISFAQEELITFDKPEYKERYYNLLEVLRCLVCQNQNLADSDAHLAQDLRDQTYDMVNNGATEQEVRDYMVARYGDFVLYEPPVKSSTLLLWFGPFILVGVATVVLVFKIMSRSENEVAALSERQKQRVAELLNKADNDNND